MRLIAVLNRHGGTLRTRDADEYGRYLQRVFSDNGHQLECRITVGQRLTQELERAFADKKAQGVIAVGGDGTASSAGALAWKAGKAVGIIPAGTMNLFARSLGIPLEIEAAADALAAGSVAKCDIASANGRAFLHQFSVGFHPRVVIERNRHNFKSRFGKISASIIAVAQSIRRPGGFPVRLSCGGEARDINASSIAVSNNRYGEGHLPYADRVDAGELGVYLAGPLGVAASAKALVDLVLGTWRANPDVEELTATELTLEFPKLRRNAKAVVDGELIPLEREVKIRIHPGELKVIRPA